MAIEPILRAAGGRWLLLLALAASSACYVTAPLKPTELARLDGYQDGQPKGGTVTLSSPANQQIEVAAGSEIYLDVAGQTYGGKFRSIRVSDGVFTGVTGGGVAVQVPMGSIQAARVREPNRGAINAAYGAGGWPSCSRWGWGCSW